MKKLQAGYTILEMSLVLVILSIIAVTIFSYMPYQQQYQATTVTKNNIDILESAIVSYLKKNSYIPCPAPKTSAIGSATFGVATDCTLAIAPAGTSDVAIPSALTYGIRIGTIPTRTLNLPDNFMFDGWNRRLQYVAVKQMAIPSTNAINFNNFSANFPDTAPDTILIKDGAGNRINTANSATIDNYVAYILISHGADGKGATSKDGASSIACSSTGVDKENCNTPADINFVDTFFNDSDPNNYYDDIVAWKTYDQLRLKAGFPTLLATTTTPSSGTGISYAQFSYSKADGSNETSAASLARPSDTPELDKWYVRPINTNDINNITGLTWVRSALASTYNYFTATDYDVISMPPGTYYIRALAACSQLAKNKLRLYNQTSGNTIDVGLVVPQNSNDHYPEVSTYLTLTTTSLIRVEHIFSGSSPSTGWGKGYMTTIDPSYDFMQIQIWKLS